MERVRIVVDYVVSFHSFILYAYLIISVFHIYRRFRFSEMLKAFNASSHFSSYLCFFYSGTYELFPLLVRVQYFLVEFVSLYKQLCLDCIIGKLCKQ